MPKMLVHGDDAASQTLGCGVAKLARAIRGTLGPRGMNTIIDRPSGSPIISRGAAATAQKTSLS